MSMGLSRGIFRLLDNLLTCTNNLDDGEEMEMTVGISEAKQKFSELVERASQGEEIIITCRGKERARLVRVATKRRRSVKEIFDSLARVRMKLPKGMTVKDLIERGRRF